MKYRTFVIKYAEIALKGKNRHTFEEALVQQMRRCLKQIDGTFEIKRVNGRVYVHGKEFDFDETVDALRHVFGITGICPAVTYERDAEGKLPSLEEIKEYAVSFMREVYPDSNASFKVKCRRVDKTYPYQCMEVDAAVGEAILLACPSMRVDVHHPEILLQIELREKMNMFSEVLAGPGGMPVGTSGRAMLLLSGGIDSPVAGYRMAKRGVQIDAVYFHAPPYTSERAKQKVIDLAEIVGAYAGKITLHVINFTDIQMYIYEKCPHDELTILMRRYMMRIAKTIAKETGCQALVTGESVGQVASQTIGSLLATDAVVESMPVFRPLIAFDKQEIIDEALRIGTYETSILPYEDCCTIFVAKHPVTRPQLKLIRQHEEWLSEKIEALVLSALETREEIVINR